MVPFLMHILMWLCHILKMGIIPLVMTACTEIIESSQNHEYGLETHYNKWPASIHGECPLFYLLLCIHCALSPFHAVQCYLMWFNAI